MDIDFRDIFGDSTPLIRKTKAKIKKNDTASNDKAFVPQKIPLQNQKGNLWTRRRYLHII